MRRPLVYIALFGLALVALTVAGYAAYWYAAAGKVRAEIDGWVQDRRAAGWLVEMSKPDLGGFPFRIEVRLADVRFAGPESDNRWSWELPPVVARAAPWRPTHIRISAPGRQSIAVGTEKIELAAVTADVDLAADSRSLKMGEARFGGVELTLPDGAALKAATARLRVDRGVMTGNGSLMAETGLGVEMTAMRVRLPETWQAPLGPLVENVALTAIATGTLNPHGTLPAALARWRDSGGALEVRSFILDWKALNLRAEGTFALDGLLQPQGAATAQIDGIDPTADALIAAGVIDARAAFAAKVANQALTLNGRPARLPLTVQDQRLFLGPVPLLRLKTIVWK